MDSYLAADGCWCNRDISPTDCPRLEYPREMAERESHVKNRSLQVYGELVVVLVALRVRHRVATCGPVLVNRTIRMDTDVDDPEQIAEDLYSGKLAGKQ